MHVSKINGTADSATLDCGRYSADGFWAVFATHPQAELLAISGLARAGYTAYLPLIAVHRRDPVVKTMTHITRVPLFSGYGFVWIDSHWVPVRYTPGIRDLLMNGSRPAIVSTRLVEQLQAEDAARCQLGAEIMPRLLKGAKVAVCDGAMDGTLGVVVECDGHRTKVQLPMFGRMMTVTVARGSVVLT